MTDISPATLTISIRKGWGGQPLLGKPTVELSGLYVLPVFSFSVNLLIIMEYKQLIHIEGKCMEDIFSLPCICSIEKSSSSYHYILNSGELAFIGDTLAEDYNGNWHVIKPFKQWNKQQKSSMMAATT